MTDSYEAQVWSLRSPNDAEKDGNFLLGHDHALEEAATIAAAADREIAALRAALAERGADVALVWATGFNDGYHAGDSNLDFETARDDAWSEFSLPTPPAESVAPTEGEQ